MTSRRGSPHRAAVVLLAVPVLLGGLAAACGDDANGDETRLEGAAAEGRDLVNERGCLSCHSTDGSTGSAPTWEGLAGSEVELEDGSTVTVDDEYLARSIRDPDADVVAGYPEGLMAASVSPGSISREEADAIVAYLNTLSEP